MIFNVRGKLTNGGALIIVLAFIITMLTLVLTYTHWRGLGKPDASWVMGVTMVTLPWLYPVWVKFDQLF